MRSTKDEDKPLKAPIRELHAEIPEEKVNMNVPAIMLEYEKHQNGIKERKKLEMDEPCKYKQGFLSIITDIKKPDPLGIYPLINFSENLPQRLILRPVFGVLNKNTLSLFENEHLSGLYATLRLNQVKSVFQPVFWNSSDITCFKILRDTAKKSEIPSSGSDSPDQYFQLCAENIAAMDSWMTAIKKFIN